MTPRPIDVGVLVAPAHPSNAWGRVWRGMAMAAAALLIVVSIYMALKTG
jgi:hypothetical protein